MPHERRPHRAKHDDQPISVSNDGDHQSKAVTREEASLPACGRSRPGRPGDLNNELIQARCAVRKAFAADQVGRD
jgi:hypothetical protein